MFRLFRRRKKDKKEKEKQEPKKEDIDSTQVEIEEIREEPKQRELLEISESVSSFEKRFSHISQHKIDTISEEISVERPKFETPSYIETIMQTEDSIQSFVSPELFSYSALVESETDVVTSIKLKEELVPITLEERIEGALFAIGRPVHVTELIENLQEESAKIKRTLRKIYRQRKRTSAIVIDEISKDRWVLHLNPIYIDYFKQISPERFMDEDERRVLTEICYRQPISLGMIKKLVRGIGPVRINEICKLLETRGYIESEKRARSLVFTSSPKFAYDFGFDDESRRLKLQMLWRLKRLMGEYEAEEEEMEEEKEAEEKEEMETKSSEAVSNLSKIENYEEE